METNKNMNDQEEGKTLSSISKRNNFSTPPDYFDTLPSEIMDRITSKPKQFIFLKPYFAIPSLTVLSAIIIVLVFYLKKDVVPSYDTELSDNDIEHIITNPELYNISESSITEQYLASVTEEYNTNNLETISEEDIKSYLEENTNENNIINEFKN